MDWITRDQIVFALRKLLPDFTDNILPDAEWNSLLTQAQNRSRELVSHRHDISAFTQASVPAQVRDYVIYTAGLLYIAYARTGDPDQVHPLQFRAWELEKQILHGTLYYADSGLPVPQVTGPSAKVQVGRGMEWLQERSFIRGEGIAVW